MATPNYMFCFASLRQLFYGKFEDFDTLYGDETATRTFILTAVLMMEQTFHTPYPPEYVDLPFWFEEDGEHKAILIGLPDAHGECDCNLVALRKSRDGKLLLVTSELYVGLRKYMLCVCGEHTHYALDRVLTSYDGFVEAVLSLKDNYE